MPLLRDEIETLEQNGITSIALTRIGDPSVIPLWFGEGDLANVATYTTTDAGVLMGVDSLDISADSPAVGSGMYYLVEPLGCGSWQTSLGGEPGRDAGMP